MMLIGIYYSYTGISLYMNLDVLFEWIQAFKTCFLFLSFFFYFLGRPWNGHLANHDW